MNNHPIAPPLELVRQWYQESDRQLAPYYVYMAHRAAQWGADQELEACCEWTAIVGGAEALRAARRPKPLSLKEQALAILDDSSPYLDGAHENIIRRALEQLND